MILYTLVRTALVIVKEELRYCYCGVDIVKLVLLLYNTNIGC